jgi:hypothetical protein
MFLFYHECWMNLPIVIDHHNPHIVQITTFFLPFRNLLYIVHTITYLSAVNYGIIIMNDIIVINKQPEQ